MAHNRVRANKNTFDSRSQSNPSAKYMERLKLGKTQPNFKWHGCGGYTYTHDASAAAYVAMCHQREAEKMQARAARITTQRLVAALTPPATTTAQKLARGVDARLGAA